ncbi:MAG: dockerin type I repeat-containing protein, partial [Ruminococcus sp.]|nr:dockerin type I repeat-containing protein [Ruminococcus sp.]
VIDKGIYHFSPEEDIYLNRLQNVLVDANDSEFIFSTPKYFKVYACDNVEIRNMIIDWDWDTFRLGSLVKIENENDAENTLEIEFTEIDEVNEDIPLMSFMQYDPVDLVAGVHGSFKIYSPCVDTECIKKVEKVDGRPNVLKITHSGALDYFRNDEVYLLRHYVYGGQVFNTVEESSNITYNNISIYGACGMGYVFAYGANHYQIINSYIGLRPGAEDKYRISTTADGIHVSNSAGYFRIDNCDLSFCGDDIVNVHDNMFYIESIDESRKIMHGTCPNKIVETGHKLKFKDLNFNNIEYEATVESITRNGYEATITLTEALPKNIIADMVAYNENRDSGNYVLTNNYVHETKGRGFLLNSDNGLCDGNTFYRTCGQTLQVQTNIPTDRVIEGTGADHIQICNNDFIECNFGGRGDVITIESLLNGQHAENTPLSEITIRDNQFTSCFQEVINADNANGLTIENNIIRDCENYIIGEHCKNVTTDSNTFLPKGDANADGEFNVADIITLQKWILDVPDAELKDWQSADLCKDGKIDVFDLCVMKRLLTENV